jgi:hypothetical protein
MPQLHSVHLPLPLASAAAACFIKLPHPVSESGLICHAASPQLSVLPSHALWPLYAPLPLRQHVTLSTLVVPGTHSALRRNDLKLYKFSEASNRPGIQLASRAPVPAPWAWAERSKSRSRAGESRASAASRNGHRLRLRFSECGPNNRRVRTKLAQGE